MRIGIDISQIIYGTGVSVYTKNLVENLLEIDKDNDYVLFGGSLRKSSEIRNFFHTLQGASFQGRIFPLSPTLADIIWNRLHLLPIEKLVGKIDVFHSSDWTQPPSRAFKVTTIHDLVPIKYPELSHPKIVAVHQRRFKWIRKEIDRIIAPSEATKVDLIALGMSEEKIIVIPEAPAPGFKPAKGSNINLMKRKYRISGNYLLAIGVTPRKNLDRIIEAFERMRAGKNLKLVVVGEPKIKKVQQRGVLFLGHVPDNDMSILYSGAEALVYPSLYEGFGLPILDAFACKTPVVTSNSGSMSEVAGNSAVLVDPYEVDSIAEGIEKAIKSRKKYIRKGLKRLKKYSWKKTAEMTLEVYKLSF